MAVFDDPEEPFEEEYEEEGEYIPGSMIAHRPICQHDLQLIYEMLYSIQETLDMLLSSTPDN